MSRSDVWAVLAKAYIASVVGLALLVGPTPCP